MLEFDFLAVWAVCDQNQPPPDAGLAADETKVDDAGRGVPPLAGNGNVASDRPFDVHGQRRHGFQIGV